MEQNNEPEALDVVNQLENGFITLGKTARALRYEAAETIRRLHARNQELEAMLEAVGAGGVSAQRVTQGKDHVAQDSKMEAAQEPFGYFKAEPFGWRDCAETDEGAIALYDAPQPQADALEATTDMLETAREDARDAQRYRWLRDKWLGNEPEAINMECAKGQRGLDAAIDAAIAAAKEI